MEKEKLWEYYVSKNPHFLTGPINFKPESLKKFFDQVWNECEKQNNDNHSDPIKNNKAINTDNPFSDIFGGIFGGIKK
jgi:hypothetical protein